MAIKIDLHSREPTACPGRYAGLAPCGAVLTARQAEALDHAAGLSATGVLVAFDADNAGRRAAVKAYHLLSPLTDATTAVIIPAGQDPAQVLQDRGPTALAGTVESRTRPLADLVVDAEVGRWARWLKYPEGRGSALRRELVGSAPTPDGPILSAASAKMRTWLMI